MKEKTKILGVISLILLLILVAGCGKREETTDYISDSNPSDSDYSSDTSFDLSGDINPNASNSLEISIERVANIAGSVEIHLTVRNISNESTYVSPTDFTLSDPSGNTINPYKDTYKYFEGMDLQSGQSTSGTINFSTLGNGKHNLNYSGISGEQQIEINIPDSNT